MDSYDETVKTAGEVAKLATKSLDVVGQFGGFLSKIFGTPAKDAYGIVGDQIDFIQWERRTRMVEIVNQYHEKKGFPPVRPISPKFAIPMIMNAGLEEDDDLQDIWCRLIANSMDANFDFEIRYAFIEMIKSLSSLDAQILSLVYRGASKYSSIPSRNFAEDDDVFDNETDYVVRKERMQSYFMSKVVIKHKLGCTGELLDVSIHNLLRVQCLNDSSLEDALSAFETIDDFDDFGDLNLMVPRGYYSLTPLGIVFVEACIIM
ncbi:Abi-alpha family protein [Methanococcoides alaskense]|uniref:DUF4393 domain-containing protein n=1 Tax=Methanococcoides alaskense TaxID=325778 RepID=A0AA90U101_9EURY|nr:Abi-alpha family protein [Methanococcoides alaskense]MDA0524216.1 Abi-alpha family protein [Methanococcoides alaskense]MDR6223661.1 hypothetical protein [Methanococcoides alaskense]